VGTVGPVEYMIIEFPGNQFKGEILPAFGELVDQGIIRFLDIVFIKKDSDGNVDMFEYDGLDEVLEFGFADIDGTVGGLLNDEDIQMTAETLQPNSSAGLIVWEHLWAAKAAEAIRNAGGVILAGERIPHEIVEAAMVGLPD
jgi:hypothetical protein